ncbi:MAG: glycosyltransferase [Clostridia bacterium]
MKKLLSIIIPTKNRQEYCILVVKHICSLSSRADFEIVIQDNSDDESLRHLIEPLCDERIVYHYHNGTLSFVDNFSEAFEQSCGDYVCYIGDDDTVLPVIFDVADFVKRNNIECFVPSLGAVYFWPSKEEILGEKDGRMTLYYVRKGCKKVDTRVGLKELIKNGGQGYQSMSIARSYHGIVSRKCFTEVKKITGFYFDGLSPDIYNAVTLSLVCKEVVRGNFPITISGICPKSGSAASATGKHTGKLANAPHFKGHDNYIWDSKIIYAYSVETIWAETVVKALKSCGEDDLYNKFSMIKLIMYTLKNNPSLRKEILNYCEKQNISLLKVKMAQIDEAWSRFLGKIKKIFITRKNDRLSFTNIKNIADAEKIVSTYVTCEYGNNLVLKNKNLN